MWFNNPGTPHSLFRMNFFSNKNWMIFFYKKNLFEEINLEGLSSFARIWIQNSYILLLWSREEEMLLISSNYQLEHGFLIDLLLEVALQIIIHFCSPRQCQILLLLMACWIYLIVLFLQKKKKNNYIWSIPSKQEIYNALSSIGSTKAPGPDGFTAMFYKKYWSIVKDVVLWNIWDFFKKIISSKNKIIFSLL